MVLTREGSRIVGEIHEAARELHEEILADVSDGQREQIIAAVELLSGAIGRWLERRAAKGEESG